MHTQSQEVCLDLDTSGLPLLLGLLTLYRFEIGLLTISKTEKKKTANVSITQAAHVGRIPSLPGLCVLLSSS